MKLRISILLPTIVLAVEGLAIREAFGYLGPRGWLFVVGSLLASAAYGNAIDRERRREEAYLPYKPLHRPSSAMFGRFYGYVIMLFAIGGLANHWHMAAGSYADGMASLEETAWYALKMLGIFSLFFGLAVLVLLSARQTYAASVAQLAKERTIAWRLIQEMQAAPDFRVAYPFRVRNELSEDLQDVEGLLKRIARCVCVSRGEYQLKEELRRAVKEPAGA